MVFSTNSRQNIVRIPNNLHNKHLRCRAIFCSDIINDIEQLYGNSDFLRKGNVFSRVCPSAILSTAGSHVTVIHDLLDLTVQGRLASTPSRRYGTSLYRDP